MRSLMLIFIFRENSHKQLQYLNICNFLMAYKIIMIFYQRQILKNKDYKIFKNIYIKNRIIKIFKNKD